VGSAVGAAVGVTVAAAKREKTEGFSASHATDHT